MKLLYFIAMLFLFLNVRSQVSIKTSSVIYKCDLKETVNPRSINIANLKKGQTVDILGYENGFFKVNYKGNIGYINDIYINEPQIIDEINNAKECDRQVKINEDSILARERYKKFKEETASDKKLKADAEARQKMRDAEFEGKIKSFKEDSIRIEKEHRKFVAQSKLNEENRKKRLIEKYGINKANIIISRKVYIGMTAEEAIDSWGYPKDINKTTTQIRVHEQWVYSIKKYLYFENGILTAIQE